jgi:microfibrillar-associated protein 1
VNRAETRSSTMSNNNFGRDEMNALFGGSTEEMAAFRPSTMVPGRDLKKKANSGDPDISTMTASETAALLLEKKADRSNNTSRLYRTNRTLAHHELAKELSAELGIKETRSKHQQHQHAAEEERDNSGEEEEFVATTAIKRSRALPQVVHSKEEPKVLGRRKRRVYDSSSSESEDEDEDERRRPRNRRRDSDDDDDDSSSSDGEEQRRRRRQQARQQLEEPKVIIPEAQARNRERTNADAKTSKVVSAPRARPPTAPKVLRERPSSSNNESSSDDDSSGSGSSSSSESSSSEEDEPVLTKPVFVPKSRRNLIPSEENKLEEEEARFSREKDREERRKMQSRALVAQQVANADSSALIDEAGDEEATGAANAPPNDDDDVDVSKERDAWEMRELERLLVMMDQEKQRAMTEREYQRRRQMTDEECMKEDIQGGRYQAPGSKREEGKPEGGMQRFYHRGAYYMDEEEWDESDVRHKAAEYAKAATGEDKIDKKQLPEIMQVKKFGFARQNHRYRGLAKEDTTDRKMEILPLVTKKKGSN